MVVKWKGGGCGGSVWLLACSRDAVAAAAVDKHAEPDLH